ncbi:hypothetical protein MKX03_018003 [Papaver bracteatum]|nr:hypothetical protein MKX03_018003 [Papaver bracteatum]
MSSTRGSSSVFLAIIICFLGSLEMASAWQNNCIAGDIYLDSTGFPPFPDGTSCKFCTDWCDAQCSTLGLPPVKYGCRLDQKDIRCKCCCGSSPPLPGSPPSPPLPPPAPQDPSEFEGGMPNSYKICKAGQESLDIERESGIKCIHEPKCEQECNKKGLSMVRKECLSAGQNWPIPNNIWYEQCCCEKLPPPPPPPVGCNTCNQEINIQISVSTGPAPCNYEVLQSS